MLLGENLPNTPGAVDYIKTTRTYIPYGFEGTWTTTQRIASLVRAWSVDPRIRDLSERIALDADDYDTYSQAVAIFYWVLRHTNYRKDPVGIELLRDPEVILRSIKARGKASLDCDDYVLFFGSLLQSIGIPVRFHKVGFSPKSGVYNHIYIEALVQKGFGANKEWLALDPTYPNPEPGKVLAKGVREMVVPLNIRRKPDWLRALVLAFVAGSGLYFWVNRRSA